MWNIGKGILWMLDGFFNIIDKIWRYQFFNNDYVNKIFSGALIVAISWLAIKVIIELIMNFIIKNDGKNSPLNIYRGIVLTITMMFLITPLFDFGHSISTALTDDVISVSGLNGGSNAESSIARAIVQSMIYTNETKESDANYFINNWKTADINETEGGFVGISDNYKYSLNFFMLIVLAIVSIFLLFFVAIQMAKRVMEIALFKIIAPFCCTSLTSNSKAFETWCRSTIGLFLITVVQFVSIGLLLAMFGSAFQENGTLIGIFLVIGALLFIIGTPNIINSLLGQQSGMMGAFGDIQSLMAVGMGASQGLGIAKAGTMGALSLGTNVLSRGSNMISGGANRITNMLNKSKNLTGEQMYQVKETFAHHNSYKARQQASDFLAKNGNGNIRSDIPQHSMKYNPIKNQYINQSRMQSKNNDLRNKL